MSMYFCMQHFIIAYVYCILEYTVFDVTLTDRVGLVQESAVYRTHGALHMYISYMHGLRFRDFLAKFVTVRLEKD